MGKIVGGGLPIGLVSGRREVMERMDHTKYSGVNYAYHGGTFAGNAITLAAGLATIQVLERDPIYEHVDRMGEKARKELNRIFKDNGFPAQATGICSLISIHTTDKEVRDARSFAECDHEKSRAMFSWLLENGVLMVVPEMLHGAISNAHTDADIEHLATTIQQFVKDDQSAGSILQAKTSST
jgi:glutamate-1-semialdehyde 2,1-aminomutase